MAIKIVFSPPLPKTVMDLARGMVPAGFDLDVLEREDPRFAQAIREGLDNIQRVAAGRSPLWVIPELRE